MKRLNIAEMDWVYSLKKKIIFSILVILALFMIVTMFFIVSTMKNNLIKESTSETSELSSMINASMRSLMLTRTPEMLQNTIENIGRGNSSIIAAFIIDKNGRVVYSSDRSLIGKVLDKYKEQSCQGCHQKIGAAPSEHTILIEKDGSKIHRNVKIIYNEKQCFGCHAQSDRITGKLIIDRSLKATYATITSVELIILGSGLVCMICLVPLLSKILSAGVNKYITEIVSRHTELSLLYLMIKRLSKTIDLDELKVIVIHTIMESLDADVVDIVFHKNYKDCRITSWSRDTNAITRKKIEKEGPMFGVIERWLNGSLATAEISDDGKVIYLPIAKGDSMLALIVARKSAAPFDPAKINLLSIMSSHISVAFENALLYNMAVTDELTGLYTPRHFRSYIGKKFEEYKKYGEKFVLLLLDIDNFKKVNDTFGHLAGDSVLKNVAKRVQSSIRDNDLAFRYGGEEFTVILPSTDSEGAMIVAERIREAIEKDVFEAGTLDLHVTASIGVSSCPYNAQTARDMILTADQSLYKAKQSGKNRVVMSDVQSQ